VTRQAFILVRRPCQRWRVARSSKDADNVFAIGGDAIEVVPAALLTEEQERVEQLERALEEMIETAEEGWEYAAEYFREKWDCDGQINKGRAALQTREDG
jgi:hypothetical protein